jgi:hypothetical protein
VVLALGLAFPSAPGAAERVGAVVSCEW